MKKPLRKIKYDVKNSPEAVIKAAMEALKTLQTESCGLDEYLDRIAEPLLRKRLSGVLFEFYRRKRLLDETVKVCCSKPPVPDVKNLLQVSLVMARFQDSLPPESVVNIAVTLARREFDNFVARFVNAVLRKAVKIIDEISIDPLPPVISQRWKKAFPAEQYHSFVELLTGQFAPAVRLRSGFEITENSDLELLPLDLPWRFYQCSNLSKLLSSDEFAVGKFYIQDPAPAHVAKLLEKHAGMLPDEVNFLDLCAAPGGKFIMNMELLDSLLKNVLSATAFDRSPRRLELVKKNLERCRVKGRVQAGDAADPTLFCDRKFELVTCDVPCSNSGVFRRRPDALWRWRKNNMPEIVKLQCSILRNAARLTAVNGLLLYSTCSLEAEENTLQISSFLQEHNEFELVEEKLFVPQAHCDGTYAALLIKRRESEQ